MDKELGCDFYFGKNVPAVLKQMDCSLLKGFRYKFRNIILFNRIVWQSDTLKLLSKNYTDYILSVDTACLSEWIFLYLAKLQGKRIYLWTHGWHGDESKFSKIKKRLFYYPAYKLLLYGDYAKGLMIKNGFNASKLVVIGNSLDYDKQLNLRSQAKKGDIFQSHFKNNCPVILFIGRLDASKRLSYLLDILSLFKSEGRTINCVFVGDGPDKNNLLAKTKEFSLETLVWFMGACYDEQKIAEIIYNADLCVSPGNVGLTAIHALTFGTPVITHDNFSNQGPEFEAIKKGITGDFFVEDNINSLKVIIEKWLNKYPFKAEFVIENCYAVIDVKYNPHKQIEKIKKSILH